MVCFRVFAVAVLFHVDVHCAFCVCSTLCVAHVVFAVEFGCCHGRFLLHACLSVDLSIGCAMCRIRLYHLYVSNRSFAPCYICLLVLRFPHHGLGVAAVLLTNKSIANVKLPPSDYEHIVAYGLEMVMLVFYNT